jgi:hypothetical protein
MISIVSASGETAFTLSNDMANLMQKNHPNSIISMMIEDDFTTISIPSPWTPCDIRMVVKEMLGYEVDVFRVFEGRTDIHTFLGLDVGENMLYGLKKYNCQHIKNMCSFFETLCKDCRAILVRIEIGLEKIFDNRDKFKKLHHFNRDIDRMCATHIKALKNLIVRRKYTNKSFETQLCERISYEVVYHQIQVLCSRYREQAQARFKVACI